MDRAVKCQIKWEAPFELKIHKNNSGMIEQRTLGTDAQQKDSQADSKTKHGIPDINRKYSPIITEYAINYSIPMYHFIGSACYNAKKNAVWAWE